MKITVLGCSGGIANDLRSTSYLVNDEILLDGGSGVGDLTLEQMLDVRHVILTHAHLDHVTGLALMLASIYDDAKESINIYAPAPVLEVLKTSLLNWHLWPDFTILPDAESPIANLITLEENAEFKISDDFSIRPVLLSHSVDSFAYIIHDTTTSLCFFGDTGPTDRIWQELNKLDRIDHIIIEVSLPNRNEALARVSAHLTPQLLADDLQKLNHNPTVHIQHIKPGSEVEVIAECKQTFNDRTINIVQRQHQLSFEWEKFHVESTYKSATENIENQLNKLIGVGLSLSTETDNALLLEKILITAKEIAHADGGTFYTVKDDNFLQMDIVRTDSLNIAIGGSSKDTTTFPLLPLHHENGEENHSNVVTCAIHDDTIINIKNRHKDTKFDFSGAAKFDESTGYNSVSFLTIPMKDHKGKMIGALQLINALDKRGNVIPFDHQTALLVKSLASQAAIALTNKHLIDELEALFESFIQMIASAIDEKSPYTGGHCRRVPELTIMLTEAIHESETGPLRAFSMNDNDRYEIKVASWLHDCGKIVTPVYVVDKATKLESIYDRINEVNCRFEVVKKDLKIKILEDKLQAIEDGKEIDNEVETKYQSALIQLEEDRAFLNLHNTGGEFMSEENQARIEQIAQSYKIIDHSGTETAILSDNEIMNLQISRGTLNNEERLIINKHINSTIDMLNSLKLPNNLKNIPEIAGGHHERMDGKGYPYGLTREQMSIPARAMGIADIFEALTAADRPYKKAKPLSESLAIMKRMSTTGHIDPDIFDVFIREEIYLKYAEQFLNDYQIDEVDAQQLLSK